MKNPVRNSQLYKKMRQQLENSRFSLRHSDHTTPWPQPIKGLKCCRLLRYTWSVAVPLRFPSRSGSRMTVAMTGGLHQCSQITGSLNVSSGDMELWLKKQESKGRSWQGGQAGVNRTRVILPRLPGISSNMKML